MTYDLKKHANKVLRYLQEKQLWVSSWSQETVEFSIHKPLGYHDSADPLFNETFTISGRDININITIKNQRKPLAN